MIGESGTGRLRFQIALVLAAVVVVVCFSDSPLLQGDDVFCNVRNGAVYCQDKKATSVQTNEHSLLQGAFAFSYSRRALQTSENLARFFKPDLQKHDVIWIGDRL